MFTTFTARNSVQLMPTLDELAADLSKAAALPPDAASKLLVIVAGLHAALQVAATIPPLSLPHSDADRFLDAAEVSAMIGKSVSWIEKNTAELPKRRRVGGEGKWSRRELIRWMKHRPAWD